MAKRDVTAFKTEDDVRPADDPNRRMILLAHERLDELCREAERSKFWGVLGVELTFEAGVIRLLHRRLDGRDKV